jgi:hypothetical protein
MPLPEELESLISQFDAADRDARAVTDGLDETSGTWRPAPGAWSVAHCLDHLAVSNRVYLTPLVVATDAGRASGRLRRKPAQPGLIGGLFVSSLEPPVRIKTKNPPKSTPQPAPPLKASLDAFLASQDDIRQFIRAVADLDLNSIRFVNPFIGWIRFSIATGLNVLAAHDRRHLWQAWNVRRASGR